jgi:NTE family protein
MIATNNQGKGTASPITVDDFVNDDKVKACLNQLHNKFGSNGNSTLVVSDVLDGEGHQYVNLVQKGGGVLGVALVGYTYILEQMGIRFLRMAGTSAGAINTALMTVIGTKTETKSLTILKNICDLNFFNLVDGHPFARLLIKSFITHKNFEEKVKNWIKLVVGLLIILSAGNIIFLGLQHVHKKIAIVTTLFFVLTGFYLLLLGTAGAYTASLLKRLKNAGFGINPGDYLYDWIKARLSENGVNTVDELNAKAAGNIPGLCLRIDNEQGLNDLVGDVTFITSELVTQNKIEFPKMCNLFREPEAMDTLHPAGFIRASMSIPVFFESYFINNIPCASDNIKKYWEDTFNELDPPSTARFVDGGILSNFPINIFYNPKVITPRLPSFGIDLDDSRPQDNDKHVQSWSLFGYFGRMFNTIRNYYDKDFQLKNKVFSKGVGTIGLADYNWLNFFLSDDDKKQMFILGAQAATKFLINFNWEEYKDMYAGMQVEMIKNKPGGNNG